MDRCIFCTILLFTCLPCTSAALYDNWPQYMHDDLHTSLSQYKSTVSSSEFSQRWAYNVGAWIRGPAVAEDLDGDGLPEIIFGADDGVLRVLDGDGNLRWEFETEDKIRASPLVSDLNGDGEREVIFASYDGRVIALDSQGNMVWSVDVGSKVSSSPVSGELSVKNGLEIVFGSEDDYVYLVSAKGSVLWKYKTGEEVISSPALGDIDGDGSMEVVVGSKDNILYVLKSPPSKVWMYQTGGDITGSPVVFDVDGNGKQEIIFGSQDGKIYCLYETLKEILKGKSDCTREGCSHQTIEVTHLVEKWNFSAEKTISSSPAVGDLDSDGNVEIVFGSEDKNLYILGRDGKRMRRFTVNSRISQPAALADLNGDGRLEILLTTTGGRLFILNNTGNRVWDTVFGAPVHTPPVPVDVDGDGILEIIVGGDDGNLRVIENKFSGTIRNAHTKYKDALKHYERGDLESAIVLAEQANNLFAEIGYERGEELVKEFFTRIDADNLMDDAFERYENGDFENASFHLHNAVHLYSEIDDENGLKVAEDFFTRIEADVLFAEGVEALNKGEINLAKDKLEETMILYEQQGNQIKAQKAKDLLENRDAELEVTVNTSMKNLIADTTYTRAWMSFYRGKLVDAIEYSRLAENRYLDVNDSVNAEKSIIISTHAHAEMAFKNAETAFSTGNFSAAFELFEKSHELYKGINYSIGVLKSQTQLARTRSFIEAQSLYDDALKYFSSGRLDSSKSLAQDALDEYKRLNNSRGVERSMYLLSEIDESIVEKEKSSSAYLLAACAIIFGIMSLVFLRRKLPWKLFTQKMRMPQFKKPSLKFKTPRFPNMQLKAPKVNLIKPKLPTFSREKPSPERQKYEGTHETSMKERQGETKRREPVKESPTRDEIIKHLQKKTRLGGPVIAGEANDLLLLLIRLHEQQLRERISVKDARDVLQVSEKTMIRWMDFLIERDKIKVNKMGEDVMLSLSNEVLGEEKRRRDKLP